jgi:hypothetical protein
MAYERIGVIPVNEGIQLLRERQRELLPGMTTRRLVEVGGTLVNATSLRLQTFVTKGITCVGCGIIATHFAIERDQGKTCGYHLNLYGNDGTKDVLFTHDHILARCLGGADNMTNTQTMCTHCNNKKSVHERIEIGSRQK